MSYLALLMLLLTYHLWRYVSTRPQVHAEPVPSSPSPDAPKVSLLVPAWQAEGDIAGFVASFRALEYPDKELILCVGGRDDGLRLARQFQSAEIRVLEQRPGEGKQRALAKCFAEATGEIIYLTDIDCRPDTTSLWRLLEPIVRGQESVVTGRSKPLEAQHEVGAVLIQWAVERKASGTEARPIDGLLGRNCALTRAAVLASGAFAFSAPTGTDYRLAQELQARGYRIWFEPLSDVRTAFAWPFGTYMRKQARWLRNVILYAERPRQAAEYRGAVIVLAIPYVLSLLFIAALISQSFLPAFIGLLLLLHASLNRLHYVRETLSAPYSPIGVLGGSILNLLATFAAGIYASFTLLTPALRKQW